MLAVVAGERVSPVLEYVIEAGPGQYDAWFGYLSNNAGPVSIPVGQNNRFTGAQDRGQPSVFQPGRHVGVFVVRFDGNNLVWTLKGPDGNTRTSTASKNNVIPPGTADLDLKATGYTNGDGDTVVIFTVKNLGPGYTAKNVKVQISLPGGYDLVDSVGDGGANQRTPTGLQWEIPALAHNAALSIQVIARGDRTQGNTEVRGNCSHQGPDPDPSNNHASYTITGQPGSADDNGLESNGRLALLLARRWVLREQAPRGKSRVRLAEGRPGTELDALIPERGPENTFAVASGPKDLIGVTNAAAVSGADYLDTGGTRHGAVLAIATDSGVYEHSKAVCERVAGGTVEQIRSIRVNGLPFLMAKLRRPDGSIEYAVSFAVSPESLPWRIDSRWNPASEPRFEGGRVFNFQVWAANAQFTETLVAELLGRMPRAVSDDPDVLPPAVFVKRARYEGGTLLLDLERLKESVETVEVAGSLAATESGERTWVEYSEEFSDELAIATGPFFDFNFRIGEDTVYVADGAWSYWASPEDGRVTEFEITPQGDVTGEGLPVERGIRASGAVETYVSFFRHLLPKAVPADLTGFEAIEFTAAGAGTLEVIPVKASIRTPSAQYRERFELTASGERYRVNLTGIEANDVTTLYFNILGQGSFELRIDDVRLIRKSEE